jgi:hypothetical protein
MLLFATKKRHKCHQLTPSDGMCNGWLHTTVHGFCTLQCTVSVHFSTSLIYFLNALSESSISLEHFRYLRHKGLEFEKKIKCV